MDALSFLFIHLIVPAAGLQLYLRLRDDMRNAQVERPPVVALFIVFATYGGWLMVGLTMWFWLWSGMASLGLFYLMFIAPIVMAVLSVHLFSRRNISRYHYGTYVASALYVIAMTALLAGLAAWKFERL